MSPLPFLPKGDKLYLGPTALFVPINIFNLSANCRLVLLLSPKKAVRQADGWVGTFGTSHFQLYTLNQLILHIGVGDGGSGGTAALPPEFGQMGNFGAQSHTKG